MDERVSLLSDLGAKRERVQAEMQRHREARDKLNEVTKGHAMRRDALNARARAAGEEANAHKSTRDHLNQQVREAKARRDALNQEAHATGETLSALRRERGASPVASAAKLRAEVRHLEFLQQTTVLSPRKEKELIDLIAAKLRQLKERDAAFERDPRLNAAIEASRAAKAAAEAQHARVTSLAISAQAAHDEMTRHFAEADALRKEADEAQAELARAKAEADAEHRAFVEGIHALRDLDALAAALRPEERSQRVAVSGKGAAEDLVDRFRRGEKLSTEDLLALQKGNRF